MFCDNCGAKIEEDCSFCVCCGAKIENVAVTVEPPLNTECVGTLPETAPEAVSVQVPDEPQPPKKSKKKKLIIVLVIVAAVLALLTGAFLLFKDYIIFAFLRLLPAKTQFRYVYNKAASTWSQDAGGVVDTVDEFLTKEETVKGSVDVELNNGLSAVLGNFGINIGNIDKASVNYNLTKNDGLTKLTLDVGNGKVKVVSAEVCADPKKGIVTVFVPEISGEVLELKISEINPEVASVFATDELLPSSQLIEKLLPKYIKLAFMQLDEVERSSDTVTVDGVSQSVTKFTVEIDEDKLGEIVITLLNEVQQDKDIEEYYVRRFDAVNDNLQGQNKTGEDYWKDFCNLLEKLIERIEDKGLNLNDAELEYVTYVNSKGEIVGISLTAEANGKENLYVKALKAQSGKEVGFVVEVEYLGKSICEVKGSGVDKNDKFTGEVTVDVEGSEFAELVFTDFDIDSLKDGKPNGTVEINISSVGSIAKRFLGSGKVGSMLNSANASIELDFSSTDKSFEMTASVKGLGMSLGKITLTGNSMKAETITIPAETEDDFKEWKKEVDMGRLLNNLKEVGILDLLSKFLLGFGIR